MRFFGSVRKATGLCGVLAMVGALAPGCAGKSQNDEDGDAGEGSGGTGGVLSTGGTPSVGGTGPGTSLCVRVCGRAQACVGAEPSDCTLDCREIAAESAAAGCTLETDRLLTCMDQLPNVCTIQEGACERESTAYGLCMADAPGGCSPGAPAPARTCEELCFAYQVCPDITPSDCALGCAQSEAEAVQTGCSAALQAFYGCASSCTDICDLADGCIDSLETYAVCVSNYCITYPSTPACL